MRRRLSLSSRLRRVSMTMVATLVKLRSPSKTLSLLPASKTRANSLEAKRQDRPTPITRPMNWPPYELSLSAKRQKRRNLLRRWPISRQRLRKSEKEKRLQIRRPRRGESKSNLERSERKRKKLGNRRLKVENRSIFHHLLSLLRQWQLSSLMVESQASALQ